jgi:hypothetical protein
MRSFTVLAGLCVLTCGQLAFSAEAGDKPIVVASLNLVTHEATVAQGSLEAFGSVGLPQAPETSKPSAPKARRFLVVAASRVTPETKVPQGSLEAFSSVGLPQ